LHAYSIGIAGSWRKLARGQRTTDGWRPHRASARAVEVEVFGDARAGALKRTQVLLNSLLRHGEIEIIQIDVQQVHVPWRLAWCGGVGCANRARAGRGGRLRVVTPAPVARRKDLVVPLVKKPCEQRLAKPPARRDTCRCVLLGERRA